MKHYNKIIYAILAALICVSMISCDKSNDVPEDTSGGGYSENETAPHTESAVTLPEIDEREVVSGNYSGQYDAEIIFSGDQIQINGNGAFTDSDTVTIGSAGTYLLSGISESGRIIIDTQDEEKIKLVLNGLDLTCPDAPPLYVVSAPKKVVIYTAPSSVNKIADISITSADEDGAPDAAIYSAEDLKFDGFGILYVTGNTKNGIVSKDDIEISGGQLIVNAVRNGIRGKDSVSIDGGNIYVTAGNDGIRSTNTENTEKGNIIITAGEINISSKGDAIAAAGNADISGGKLTLKTQGESSSTDTTTTDKQSGQAQPGMPGFPGGRGGPGGPGGPGGMQEGNPNKSAISAKGIKAGNALTVSGNAEIIIDSADDSLHSDNSLLISGGNLTLSSNDDGIHSDKTLTVNDGYINILKSYEGLESAEITVNGGNVRVVSSDDGFNASDGSGSGIPGGFGGRGQSQQSSSVILKFTGGYVYVNASGDGIDSNGNIVMTGGTVIIMGPTDNGNGAIDFGDGNCNMTISGGLLLAAGSSGMAETATNNGQAVLSFSLRSSLGANTLIGIFDENGQRIALLSPEKTFASVVFSCPELVSGATYTICSGGTTDGKISDGIITDGSYSYEKELGNITAK